MRELANQDELRPESCAAAADHSSRMNYSLSSLMLVVTLACGLSGVWTLSPALAILLTLCTLPALVRTAISLSRQARKGQATTVSEKLQFFITHCCEVFVFGLVMLLIGPILLISGGIMLSVIAIPIVSASNGSPEGIAISLLLFLGLSYFVILRVVARGRKKHRVMWKSPARRRTHLLN